MRNITQIQRRLIERGFMSPIARDGGEADDGKFGHDSLDAYNRFRASIGKGPLVQASMAELNADLFPEDAPPVPQPRTNPISDYFTGIAIKAVLSSLKGRFPMLTGYKTYLTAGLMIIVAAASLLGVNIGDYHPDPIALFTAAVGIIFARNGAKTEVKKAAGQL